MKFASIEVMDIRHGDVFFLFKGNLGVTSEQEMYQRALHREAIKPGLVVMVPSEDSGVLILDHGLVS